MVDNLLGSSSSVIAPGQIFALTVMDYLLGQNEVCYWIGA